MNDYLKTMGNYSPVADATGKVMGEIQILQVDGAPNTTAIKDEELPADAPYMAPKTIEVRRYTLKK